MKILTSQPCRNAAALLHDRRKVTLLWRRRRRLRRTISSPWCTELALNYLQKVTSAPAKRQTDSDVNAMWPSTVFFCVYRVIWERQGRRQTRSQCIGTPADTSSITSGCDLMSECIDCNVRVASLTAPRQRGTKPRRMPAWLPLLGKERHKATD